MGIYLGQIELLPLLFIQKEKDPMNWTLCDGKKLSIDSNKQLFALISNRFGGDGIHDFAVPDLTDANPLTSAKYFICTKGTDPMDSMVQELYVGEIRLFPFEPTKTYFVKCDGSRMSIQQDMALYDLLRNQYGNADYNHFCLPNMLGTEPAPNMNYYISRLGYYPPNSNAQ